MSPSAESDRVSYRAGSGDLGSGDRSDAAAEVAASDDGDGGAHLVRVTVGRIGRPHGIRGDVAVRSMTDEPDRRFAPGALLIAGPPVDRVLQVARSRWHGRQLVVGFDGVGDREAAGGIRGAMLEADVPVDEQPSGDRDEYFDRALIGLTVIDNQGGNVVGVVRDVLHLPGQDLLVVREGEGSPETLIPFVSKLVPEVDLSARQIRVELPAGLIAGTEEGLARSTEPRGDRL